MFLSQIRKQAQKGASLAPLQVKPPVSDRVGMGHGAIDPEARYVFYDVRAQRLPGQVC